MIDQRDDTPIAEVSNIDDRRRIRDLEAKSADLERKLADALLAAQGRARPALEYTRDECYHYGAPKVSDQTPSVTCGDCGVELDPYDVLRAIAHREFNFCYQLNALREESRRLQDEIKRLKATRARLRRELKAPT